MVAARPGRIRIGYRPTPDLSLTIHNDFRNQAAGHRGQHIAVIGANPMITAWRLSQVSSPPVRHHIVVPSIGRRQAVASGPVRRIAKMIAVVGFVLIAIVAAAAVVAIVVMTLLKATAVSIVVVTLRCGGRGTEYQYWQDFSYSRPGSVP